MCAESHWQSPGDHASQGRGSKCPLPQWEDMFPYFFFWPKSFLCRVVTINTRARPLTLLTACCSLLSHTPSPACSMQILICTLVLSCCVWAAIAHNQDGGNAAEAGRTKSIWEENIQFVTKTKDRCSMTLTGHGELTSLRVSCVGQEVSYWCEYEGKPDVCRNYNNNPRHFFMQIMWELRKLNNACQGPQTLKPTMCKKASDESQMVFTTSSLATEVQRPLKPQTTQTTAVKQDHPKPELTKSEPPTSAPRSDQAKPEQKQNGARLKPSRQKPTKPQPTRPSPARPAKAKTEPVKAEPAKPVVSKPVTKTTPQKKILEPKAATQAPTTTTPPTERSAENLAQQYCLHGMQDFCTKIIGWFTK